VSNIWLTMIDSPIQISLYGPGNLPFLFWLVLPDANRAGRIALANGFLDFEKLGFAMQIGTARNVKDFIVRVLGHGYKSRNCRRIGRTRPILVLEPGPDRSFR
jgi:hypothetical protein